MNARTVALYHSLRHIAAVVDSYPDLRARAGESRAFELFLAVIDDFEALLIEDAATPLELKQLAARKKHLTTEIHFAIDALVTTASLIPNHIPIPPCSAPAPHLTTFPFSYEARALFDVAAQHAPIFIDAGLHPRTFDDARALITQLIDTDLEERLTLVRADSFPARLDITIDVARKRRRQLASDLRHAMTAESAAAWSSAAALGRVHRPKRLSAPDEPKLLTARDSGDSEPGDGGIKRLARRVRLYLPRNETT